MQNEMDKECGCMHSKTRSPGEESPWVYWATTTCLLHIKELQDWTTTTMTTGCGATPVV